MSSIVFLSSLLSAFLLSLTAVAAHETLRGRLETPTPYLTTTPNLRAYASVQVQAQQPQAQQPQAQQPQAQQKPQYPYITSIPRPHPFDSTTILTPDLFSREELAGIVCILGTLTLVGSVLHVTTERKKMKKNPEFYSRPYTNPIMTVSRY